MSVTWNHEIRDGNMIYREGCCLSTDTKPTSDPTLGNGSKLLEMDTSKMWIYDADGCEWFGPDGALNDTIRFIRPKLIYNDEYVGIDFRLKLPAGKTPSDYPGSYVKFDGTLRNNNACNSAGTVVNANTQWTLGSIGNDGSYHIQIMLSFISEALVYTPTFYYTDNGTATAVIGQGYSLENVLGFEIERTTGRYAEELKSYADLCYYVIRFQNRASQSIYTNSILRYSFYDKTPYETQMAYHDLSDHYSYFQDEDVPTVGATINFRPKLGVGIGVVVADGYTIQSGTVDDVSVTVGSSWGRRTLNSAYLPTRTSLSHIFVFKINDIVRARSSVLGYLYAMVNSKNYETDKTLHNWAYATLQYAKITHQI